MYSLLLGRLMQQGPHSARACTFATVRSPDVVAVVMFLWRLVDVEITKQSNPCSAGFVTW